MEFKPHKITLLIGIICIFVSVLTGCDGAATGKTIQASTLYSDFELEVQLPKKTRYYPGDYYAYGGHEFNSSLSLEELKELVEEQLEESTLALYGTTFDSIRYAIPSELPLAYFRDNGVLHIQVPTGEGVLQFMIRSIDVNSERYLIRGMDGELVHDMYLDTNTEGFSSNGQTSLLLPLHYISDIRVHKALYITLCAGADYELAKMHSEWDESEDDLPYSLEKRKYQFLEFYQNSGWYEVSDTEVKKH